MDPLRISGAWICVAGVLAVAHLLFALDEAVLLTWIVLWFTYGLAGLLFTHFVYTRRVRSWYRCGDIARRVATAGMTDHALTLAHHLSTTRDTFARVPGLFFPPLTGSEEGGEKV